MRKACQQSGWWLPDAGIAHLSGTIIGVRPLQADVPLRGEQAEAVVPWFRIEPGDGEEDGAHQGPFRPSPRGRYARAH